MADQSNLDNKYFIDQYRYNCPFCNRRSVTYAVSSWNSVNWSDDKVAYVYRITCGGCGKISIHFSYYNFEISYNRFHVPEGEDGEKINKFEFSDLDDYFFYHNPTSFFTINSLIPKTIRELVSEAEGCKKMNFLVGASGSLRKAIYEFLKLQEAEGENYQEKIKWLKKKYPIVDPILFDTLGNIQDMTSENMHEKEGSWKPWKNKDLEFLVELVRLVLDEVYVIPLKRKSSLDKLNQLKSKSELSKVA